jgi:Tfp pilus assembly protein PilN
MAKTEQTVTGLVVRGGYLEWTTLRQRKGKVEKAAQERADAGLEPPVDLNDEVQAKAVYKAFGGGQGAVSVSIPSSKGLLRVVDLPATEPDELMGMAEFQVDKFAPFQLDRLKISYEILSQDESSSRVLIVAVQRHFLEAAGNPFLIHSQNPDRVDIEVLGWWRLLKDHGDIQDEGRQVVLLLEPGGAELIFVQDGQPVILRTLGGHSDPSDKDFVEEVSEETHYTLTSMESEWGVLQTSVLHLWHWGDVPEPLCRALEKECDVQVRHRSFDELPPLSEGIARRQIDQSEGVNLCLEEWRDMESSRKLKKRLLVSAAAVMTVWVIGMAVLVAVVKTEEPRYQNLLQDVTALEGQAAEVKQLKSRLDELELYADRTYSVLECLRELSLLLPSGVEWTSLSYKKQEGVDLRGQAPSADPVYDYVEALERSALFESVTPDDIRTRVQQGVRMTQFKIEAQLPGGEEI